jgi:predicted RNase H-like HicB family nuclease
VRGGSTLEEALTRLNDWAAGVTRSRQEREAEMVAYRNTQHMAAVGIDMEGVLT